MFYFIVKKTKLEDQQGNMHLILCRHLSCILLTLQLLKLIIPFYNTKIILHKSAT